ncbi:ATP-dependent nuclease [Methanospirillum lacunae]|uniref:OLD protein-like TOPRIM domain-containing protein n=1 Tax=Methanospirillum lacunae TaxID=668570 RepID=A0A2V2N8K4_9EURY|nr:DUF2813 domain-containing protein [Methanospirillum lacunae]PWR72617.1 hypothetical protein DK846_06530 [Methanospirillum lacunae]
MKLRHLHIQNFRGINNLELELSNTNVLVGENNSGKTAVLDALRLSLRGVRSRRGCIFTAYDFHLSDSSSDPTTAPPIVIKLLFREDEAGEWDDELVARLNRIKIAQIDKNGLTSVIFKVDARFDPVQQDFVQNWEFLNLDGAVLTNINDSAISILQNEVSYYYLAALRDATKHFDPKGTYWRPFLKESELTEENKNEIEKKLAEINELIISSHGSFDKVIEKLKEVQQVVPMKGGDNLVSVDAIPSRLFDMLERAQVNINTGTGAKIPVARHGEGTQSLAVLTLFNAFLQSWNNGEPFVALEEPESHLHPCAIRALWRLIERIPGQKIISTHSGDLLSEVPPESIIRLYRKSNCVTSGRIKDAKLDQKKLRQFNYHIRTTRGELLFSRCWILGEGESEVTLFPELARTAGNCIEKYGIRCIGYRQSDISLFIQVADAMGIHWIALTDNDGQGKSDQEKIRKALESRNGDVVHFSMPEDDIEQHLCVSGFSHVYESFLTKESLANISANPTDPEYYSQLTKAVSKHKISAIHKVIEEIQGGAIAPELLMNTLKAAIRCAEIP